MRYKITISTAIFAYFLNQSSIHFIHNCSHFTLIDAHGKILIKKSAVHQEAYSQMEQQLQPLQITTH